MSEWNRDEDEDDQEGNFDDAYRTYDDHIIFLIDGRECMYQKNEEGEELIRNSLKVALAVMKTKIIANNRSSLGIYFFGAENKSSDTDISIGNIFTLFPLDALNAAEIRRVQNLILDPMLLRQTVVPQPSSISSCPLKTALWTCAQAFNTKTRKAASTDFSYRRIWIFTNDDNPNSDNPPEQARIVQVVKDAAATGIEVSLWSYNPPTGNSFDVDRFYGRVLRASADGMDRQREESVAAGSEAQSETETSALRDISSHIQEAGDNNSFDSILGHIRRKEYSKRALGSLPMFISSSVSLAVNMYKVLQVAKKPSSTWLVARSNRPAKMTTRYLNKDSGAPVDSHQICTVMDFGGTSVPFSKADITRLTRLEGMSDNDEGFLRIMRFTPLSALTPELNLTGPVFIFPNENKVKGSAALFRALLDDLIAKQLIGIAVFARNKAANPRIVAMVPQQEIEAENEAGVLQSGGFNLIALPFDGEVRSLHTVGLATPPDDAVEAAVAVVRSLQMDEQFNYTELENPALQRFYSVLQAVALTEADADWRAEEHDMLQPDPEGVAVHKDKLEALLSIAGCAEEPGVVPKVRGFSSKGRKRATEDVFETVPTKRATGVAESLTVEDVEKLVAEIKSDSISRRTVAELKEACKGLGQKVAGTKAELIARLKTALASDL